MNGTKLLMAALATSLLITACNKDDENPQNETTIQKVADYNGMEEVDFRVFIGGQEVNTVGLNPEDFLTSNALEAYADRLEFGNVISFNGDSLLISSEDFPTSSYGYEFTNGELVITDLTTEGEAYSQTIAYGTINSFEVRFGVYTYCKTQQEWPFKDCEDGTTNFYYYTPDSVSADLEMEDILSDMTAEDTLAIYNYRYLFN